jgi:hypothetical protein
MIVTSARCCQHNSWRVDQLKCSAQNCDDYCFISPLGAQAMDADAPVEAIAPSEPLRSKAQPEEELYCFFLLCQLFVDQKRHGEVRCAFRSPPCPSPCGMQALCCQPGALARQPHGAPAPLCRSQHLTAPRCPRRSYFGPLMPASPTPRRSTDARSMFSRRVWPFTSPSPTRSLGASQSCGRRCLRRTAELSCDTTPSVKRSFSTSSCETTSTTACMIRCDSIA